MSESMHTPILERELPLPRLDASLALPDDLPVSGGWGYSKQDACIITDDTEPADDGLAHGLDFEFIFIEHRLIEELNAMSLHEELADIRWKVQTQEIHRHPDGSPAYDCFQVHVSAYLRTDLELVLREEAAMENGEPDLDRVVADKRRNLRLVKNCEYWFDISRVKGIPDDAEFSMRVSRGRIHSPHEQQARPH